MTGIFSPPPTINYVLLFHERFDFKDSTVEIAEVDTHFQVA